MKNPSPNLEFRHYFEGLDNNSTFFFTDGSKKEGSLQTGIGIFCPSLRLFKKYKIFHLASIFTAEAIVAIVGIDIPFPFESDFEFLFFSIKLSQDRTSALIIKDFVFDFF